MSFKQTRRAFTMAVSAAMILTVTACGTLLYPERRGQDKGNIDTAVVILDGIGVLLFVVPGLLAFIVDFATGAIYLPGGKSSDEGFDSLKDKLSRQQLEDARVVYFDAKTLTPEQLEEMVRESSGRDFHLDNPQLSVYRLSSDLMH